MRKRELVYLSAGKLRQLAPGRRRGLLGRLKVGINPFGYETDIYRNASWELDRAIEQLDAAWFTEPVMANQWVQFEAPMSYTTFGPAVVFLDVAEPSDMYPTGGEIRLLLHGSCGNLVSESPPASVTTEELSDLAATRSVYHPNSLMSPLNHFMDLIKHRSDEDSDKTDADPNGYDSWFKRNIGAASLHHAISALNDHLRLPETAGWMRGYARVTGVAQANDEHPYTLFASPLYVEFSGPPSKDD